MKNFMVLCFLLVASVAGSTDFEDGLLKTPKDFWAFNDSVESAMNLSPPMRHVLPPLSKFTKFQTFNEFKMAGEGKPLAEPFVYVLDKGNEIFVKKSSDTQKTMRYVRIGDVWYNYQNIVQRKYERETVDGCLCIGERYNRIIVNDSIIEFRNLYAYNGANGRHEPFWQYGNTALKFLYIKTSGHCVVVRLAKNDFVNPRSRITDMREMAYMLRTKPEKVLNWQKRNANEWRYIKFYSINEDAASYIFTLDDEDVDAEITFLRTSLGLYGIQPGQQGISTSSRKYRSFTSK